MKERKILLGNEAIAYALIESGCHVVTSYPGTPASEILETVMKIAKAENIQDLHAEWSVNEKVAFETALTASYTGLRAAVAMKQVGLNVAADALMSAAYTGVKGGFVIFSADDPGPHSSQTEQDSRFLAMLAKVPVFDPSTPQEAGECVSLAFELSERYEIPVMIRPTTRVCHARQDITIREIRRIPRKPYFEKNPHRWAATPKFRFMLHRELNQKIADISEGYRPICPNGSVKHCIVASGVVWAHAREIMEDLGVENDVHLIKVFMSYPLSRGFVDELLIQYERILVLEETYPVMELQFNRRDLVAGRSYGIVPSEGELLPEEVEKIIRRWLNMPVSSSVEIPSAPGRRPTLCPGCGHRPVFYAIRKTFPKGIYPGDIGCYTLGLNLGAVDTVLCMGASVAQAAGFSHAFSVLRGDDTSSEEKTGTLQVIATIGDSTFFHAGIPPLLNAVVHGAKFILVILDNGTTAMTGHQPTLPVMSNGGVSIEKLVEACGVKFVRVVDPYRLPDLMDLLKEAGRYVFDENKGIAVIIAHRPCIMDRQQDHGFSPVVVDVTDDCTGCQLCIERFECPALVSRGAKNPIEIDRVVCTKCGVCVHVCPYGGLKIVG